MFPTVTDTLIEDMELAFIEAQELDTPEERAIAWAQYLDCDMAVELSHLFSAEPAF